LAKYISYWYKQFLVKFNPTKTDIVYFSTKDIPPELFILIENTRIYPIKCHKYLGITLSTYCKLSNHINTIVEKTSNKWQFCENLNSWYPEIVYLTFIHLLIEYAGEAWYNCAVTDSVRLEKFTLKPHV